MAVAALRAINGVNLFGARGGPSSVKYYQRIVTVTQKTRNLMYFFFLRLSMFYQMN